jgi:hypothetical protein
VIGARRLAIATAIARSRQGRRRKSPRGLARSPSGIDFTSAGATSIDRATVRAGETVDTDGARRDAWPCRPSETFRGPTVYNISVATGLGNLPMSSAPSAPITPTIGDRVVIRHSVIVRICHWINAICLFVLLISGLQIFNAHPMLNWGNATDFKRPFLSLSAHD